jgi:MYXO-CTERM domain-containing protein
LTSWCAVGNSNSLLLGIKLLLATIGHARFVALIGLVAIGICTPATASMLLLSAPAGNAIVVLIPNAFLEINQFFELGAPEYGISPAPISVGSTTGGVPSTSGTYVDFYYGGPNPVTGFGLGMHVLQTVDGFLGTVTGATEGNAGTASETVHFSFPTGVPYRPFDMTFNFQFVPLPGLSLGLLGIVNQAPQSGSEFDLIAGLGLPSSSSPPVTVDPSQPVLRMLVTSITTPIPEPPSLALAACGLVGLTGWCRRRRKGRCSPQWRWREEALAS